MIPLCLDYYLIISLSLFSFLFSATNDSSLRKVALNYQTEGTALSTNNALFEVNGRCGYVLKPEYLRRKKTSSAGDEKTKADFGSSGNEERAHQGKDDGDAVDGGGSQDVNSSSPQYTGQSSQSSSSSSSSAEGSTEKLLTTGDQESEVQKDIKVISSGGEINRGEASSSLKSTTKSTSSSSSDSIQKKDRSQSESEVAGSSKKRKSGLSRGEVKRDKDEEDGQEKVKITVITGQTLAHNNKKSGQEDGTSDSSEVVDPYVVIQLYGHPNQKQEFKTKYIKNNGMILTLMLMSFHSC